MPVQIKLGKIFDKKRMGDAVSASIKKTLKEFAAYVPEQQKESTPTGELYRRGGFSGRNKIGGYKASGKGTRIHRASAKGQRPAIDTGKLSRGTKSKMTGKYKGEVYTAAKRKGFDYADHLENKAGRHIQNDPADIKAAEEMMLRNAEAAVAKLI